MFLVWCDVLWQSVQLWHEDRPGEGEFAFWVWIDGGIWRWDDGSEVSWVLLEIIAHAGKEVSL